MCCKDDINNWSRMSDDDARLEIGYEIVDRCIAEAGAVGVILGESIEEREMEIDTDKFHIMHQMYLITSPRYTCLRPPGPAGAVIVTKDDRKRVFGFVSSPIGPSCKQIGCEIENGHCVRAIHAEQNAIVDAAKLGISIYDAEIYSILKPCYECSKHIIAAGIRHIYYAGVAYDEERTRALLIMAGVSCVYIDIGLPYAQELVDEALRIPQRT